MSFVYLQPYPVQLSYFNWGMKAEKGYRLEKRTVHDYEIELIVDSDDGKSYLNGEIIDLKCNDIVFRKPGDVTQAIMRYACYLICFDLSNEYEHVFPNFNIRETGKIQKISNDDLTKSLNFKLNTKRFVFFRSLFEESFQSFLDADMLSVIKISNNITRILLELYREQQDKLLINSAYYNMIKEANIYMEKNYNKNIKLEDVARHIGFSRNYFIDTYKRETNKTPMSFLHQLRLSKTKDLLVFTNKPMKEIAKSCGFSSFSYFSSFFKQRTNMTPKEFRNNHRTI